MSDINLAWFFVLWKHQPLQTPYYLSDVAAGIAGACAEPVLFFEKLFAKYPAAFDQVVKHKADYRLQIIYTRVDRDRNNNPHLTTYTYDADTYYYYCASLIKLPASVLALEKLNNLARYKVTMMDSLGIDSIACGALNAMNMMLGTPYSCLAQYIKEMLLISNNKAFNPVYDFLGQRYFQDRLHQIGCHSAAINSRFASCDTTQDRFCNPVSLYDRRTHRLKYRQPCSMNSRKQFYTGHLNTQVGTAYVDASNKLIKKPMDFHYSNYIALSEVHNLLTRIIFPQTSSAKLNLTKADYQYLEKCMGMFPGECAFPKLSYPDQYMNYFMGPDTGASVMPAHVRTINKVGQAYGFMTDCSYVADTLHKVEFFISCSMYLNADGVINDGVYEYDKIGYPFFHDLYKAIYADELARHKKYAPKIQLPDFADAPAIQATK